MEGETFVILWEQDRRRKRGSIRRSARELGMRFCELDREEQERWGSTCCSGSNRGCLLGLGAGTVRLEVGTMGQERLPQVFGSRVDDTGGQIW